MENHDRMLDIINNFSFIENGYYAQKPRRKIRKWEKHAKKSTAKKSGGGGRAATVRTKLEAHRLVFTTVIFTNAKRTLKTRN